MKVDIRERDACRIGDLAGDDDPVGQDHLPDILTRRQVEGPDPLRREYASQRRPELHIVDSRERRQRERTCRRRDVAAGAHGLGRA